MVSPLKSQQISLITPKLERNSYYPIKRTREEFESDYAELSYQNGSIKPSARKSHINPRIETLKNPYPHDELASIQRNLVPLKTNTQAFYEPQNEKEIERTRDVLISNKEKQKLFKTLIQNVEYFLEQDEKFTCITSVKDFRRNNDEYEWFDNDFFNFNFFPFPQNLLEKYEEIQRESTNVMKGIITSLNAAYLVIDCTLYIWNIYDLNGTQGKKAMYEHATTSQKQNPNIHVFGPFASPITAVGFGNPAKTVLVQSEIKNLLVVALQNEIRLFQINFSEKGLMIEEVESSISTGNMIIQTILCSNSGRIFIGGTQGVFEIDYKEFSILGLYTYSKCFTKLRPKRKFQFLKYIPEFFTSHTKTVVQLSVDESRYILYALFMIGDPERESYEVVYYDLGYDNTSFVQAGVINYSSLRKSLRNVLGKAEQLDTQDLKISYISAVDKTSSSDINLAILTKSGLRIFIKLESVEKPIESSLWNTYFQRIPYDDAKERMAERERPTGQFSVIFVKQSPVSLSQKWMKNPDGTPLPENRPKLDSNLFPTQMRRTLTGHLKHDVFLTVDSLQSNHNNSYPEKTVLGFSLNLANVARSKDLPDFFLDNIREYSGLVPLTAPNFLKEEVMITSYSDGDLSPIDVSELLCLNTPVCKLERSYMHGGTTGTMLYSCLNELVRQTYLPPKHFLIMTPLGIEMILKARPIDLLFQYIKAPPEERYDPKELAYFIDHFGSTETCTMLLEIICNVDMEYYVNDFIDQRMRENFYTKVAEPYKNRGKNQGNAKSGTVTVMRATDSILKKAIEAYFHLGNTVTHRMDRENKGKREPFERLGKAMFSNRKKFSSKLDSLLIYFSRLVRPLWGRNLANIYAYRGIAFERLESFKQNELNIVRRKIMELRSFLRSENERLLTKGAEKRELLDDKEKGRIEGFWNGNPQYREDVAPFYNNKKPFTFGADEMFRVNPEHFDEDILWEEQKIIDNFYNFLENVKQTIDLALFFSETNELHTLIDGLSQDEKNKFFNLRYQDLFQQIEGGAIVKSLLTNFLKKNGRDFQKNAEYFKQTFQTFFSDNDYNISTAEYYLEIASKMDQRENTKEEKHKYILDAVNLLFNCISSLTRENLDKIFIYLKDQKYFLEIVRLCLKKLIYLDKLYKKVGGSHNASWNNENQISSIQNELNEYFNFCQERIMNIFENLHHTISNFKKIRLEKGQLFYGVTLEECLALKDRIIKEIGQHPEFYLHTNLIKWLYKEKLYKDILNIESEFLEQALKEENDQYFLEKNNLLYKYFSNTQQYIKAYNTALLIAIYDQSELRTDESDPEFVIMENQVITLKDRIMYLNYAHQSLSKVLEAKSNSIDNVIREDQNDLMKRQKIFELQEKIQNRMIEKQNFIKVEIQTRAEAENIYDEAYQELLRNKRILDFKASFLSRKLFDLDVLNKEFIENYYLYDCQLFIWDLRDESVLQEDVQEIYNKLIQKVYDDYLPRNEWQEPISAKLREIYQSLKNPSRLFPHEHVIFTLENINMCHPIHQEFLKEIRDSLVRQGKKLKSTGFWIPLFMTSQLGFSFNQIFKVYLKYFRYNMNSTEKRDRRKDMLGFALHSIKCMIALLQLWTQQVEKNYISLELDAGSESTFGTPLIDLQANYGDILEVLKESEEFVKDNLDKCLIDNQLSCITLHLIQKILSEDLPSALAKAKVPGRDLDTFGKIYRK